MPRRPNPNAQCLTGLMYNGYGGGTINHPQFTEWTPLFWIAPLNSILYILLNTVLDTLYTRIFGELPLWILGIKAVFLAIAAIYTSYLFIKCQQNNQENHFAETPSWVDGKAI